MPVFRYQCRKCGAVESRLVARFDEEVACRACGGETEKLPSVFAAPPSSPASKCGMADTCPSAGGHTCGCGCGCGGHHHG